MWTVPREWPGETVFLVAGGPSLASCDLTGLRGRRVVAINSSYAAVPWADVLYFSDTRWWNLHRRKLGTWAGRIVTVAPNAFGDQLLKLQKARDQDPKRLVGPAPLSTDPRTLSMGRSSTQAALNLVVHLGVARVVLLGVDMGPGADGRTHHHAPHPWPQQAGCWDEQMRHLAGVVPRLADLGVEVLNASPTSRLPWWPKVTLESCLCVGGP